MNLPKIISFLASELERHRADLVSMADLQSLGVIEASLNDAGVTDEATHAIAWIGAVVPAADRDAVKAAYGSNAAQLLERLVPIQYLDTDQALGRSHLWARWAEATQQEDATLRALATALLVAEKTKMADAKDKTSFLGLIETAIESAGHTGTRELLIGLHDDIEATRQAHSATTANHPLLISPSIDVVGSTEAKTRLRNLAADDTQRHRLYHLFYNSFLDQEGQFLDDLFTPGVWGKGLPLDWRRLFVIKGIGDELWMTYDVGNARGDPAKTNAEIRRATVRLVHAALNLVGRVMSFSATGTDPGLEFEEILQPIYVDLPFKVTMDLIEDAIEISDLRMAHLVPKAGKYLADQRTEFGQTPSMRRPFGADHVEILNRLNAGIFALVGGHRVRQVYRTDLISNDVDRFFRITKEALPGCVLLGDNLFRRLEFGSTVEVAPGIDRTEMCFASDPYRLDSVVRTNRPILSMRTEIPAGKIKGIGAPYTVHHLITPEHLRLLLYRVTRYELFRPLVEARSAELLPGSPGPRARRDD